MTATGEAQGYSIKNPERLLLLAKERGVAIGTASALPVSINRINAWIKTLDSHGIMLVPLTTAMLKTKSS